MLNVLHVCPHLGGGVGRLYKNLLDKDQVNKHTFALLEEPKDKHLLPDSDAWFLINDKQPFFSAIEKSDIVQIEFWNHPSLYSALREIGDWPPCRLILYSHISGLFPPAYLPKTVVECSDHVVLSTAASLGANSLIGKTDQVTVIPGFGGAGKALNVEKKRHDFFQVLYVGTADRLKIHPELIKWCVDLAKMDRDLRFVFCTLDRSEELVDQVPEGYLPVFQFHEKVRDIRPMLSESDVFGYALQPRHFGTGEQAILEAMGAGLPAIVMDNPAEKQIVSHGVNGFIAKNGTEYKDALLFFKKNPDILQKFSVNARESAKTNLSPGITVEKFQTFYSDISESEKRLHQWPEEYKSVLELFLLSQGTDSDLFRSALSDNNSAENRFSKWQLKFYGHHLSESKGSVKQWSQYFPEENSLQSLISLIEFHIMEENDKK